MYSIKYDLLNRPLEFAKTHDFCKVKDPVLTVVFLHGIASDSSCFYHALQYLEGTSALDNVRFVTFDLLGSGKSYKSDKLEYNYAEMLSALENSLAKLDVKTPLVLVGHSLGTLIATRYAATHKKTVKKLILISPPVYTEEDLDNPAMEMGLKAFRDAVKVKQRSKVIGKDFEGPMQNIVLDRKNYKTLINLTTPAVLIYGDVDRIIAPHNVRKAVKENPKYLKAKRTVGRHGMSREKYNKVREVLEEVLSETI